jgi:hypothetical protein
MTGTRIDDIDGRIVAFLDARAQDVAAASDVDDLVRVLDARLVGRRARRANARLLLVMATTGLLVAGLIGAGLLGGPSVEESTPRADIFRSPTSFGTIEWTRAVAPAYIWPDAMVDGVVMGKDGSGSWWRLDEDLAWQRVSAPEPARTDPWADFGTVGDETWAVVGSDSYSVSMGPKSYREVIMYDWYEGVTEPAVLRHAFGGWVDVPLPSLRPPNVDGLETFGPLLHPIASVGVSSWVMPVQHFLEIPWDRIYDIEREGTEIADLADLDGDTVSSIARATWDATGDRLLLRAGWPERDAGIPLPADAWREEGTPDEPFSASLAVELVDGDRPVIEFRDLESGELVHVVDATLPGWSAEELLFAVRGWGGLDLSFVVGQGSQTSLVRPPWPMSEEWSGELVVSGDRYYTTSYQLGDDFSAMALHLWRSSDGLAWESVELPTDFPRPLESASIAAGVYGLGIWVTDHPAGDESVWLSEHGTDWAKADLGSQPAARISGTDFGWFLDSGVASGDGANWERIELPPLPDDPPIGYLHGFLVRGPAEVEGRYETWFGKLVE